MTSSQMNKETAAEDMWEKQAGGQSPQVSYAPEAEPGFISNCEEAIYT